MKRYELFDRDNSGSETEPVEYLDGDWVRYQDAVTAVAAERERWRAALSHTVAEADGWHDESHGGPIMSDPKMEDARALLHPAIAQPVRLAACQHSIVDARNQYVESGYVCIKCRAVFSAADHEQQVQPADRQAQDEGICNACLIPFNCLSKDAECHLSVCPNIRPGWRAIALSAAVQPAQTAPKDRL